MTTVQNYQAVKSGRSALMRYEGKWPSIILSKTRIKGRSSSVEQSTVLPSLRDRETSSLSSEALARPLIHEFDRIKEAFCASLFTEEQNEAMMVDGYTRFESVVLHSVRDALSRTHIDVSSDRVVFILSTTKGNIEVLDDEQCDEEREYPASAAQKVADAVGITTRPIVVCNACISGVAAQVLALRLINAGKYDYAVVAGADCQSPFIVSGFQSFKAVSEEPCRPFDIERLGLNLGEAAATIVFAKDSKQEGADSDSKAFDDARGTDAAWGLYKGCVRNDAFHISSPSPKGDGSFATLAAVLDGVNREDLAMVSVHGTATMYNDQMESKAIQRAELSDVPVSALKGYYGHTMGAAGLLETIISMCSIDEGIILANRGYEELGVSGKVNITAESRTTDKTSFIKMLSGFGGCNGALLLSKSMDNPSTEGQVQSLVSTDSVVRITTDRVEVNGNTIPTEATGKSMLTEVYKSQVGDYPKFYKMDCLARLAFVASELLMKTVKDADAEHTSIVLFNRTSSIVSDRQHHSEMLDIPSPSVFVYTLPNIMTGEIAIRNGIKGETSLYIINEKDWSLMDAIASTSLGEPGISHIIYGWVDYKDDTDFSAEIKFVGVERSKEE